MTAIMTPCEILLANSSSRRAIPNAADVAVPSELISEVTNSMEILIAAKRTANGIPSLKSAFSMTGSILNEAGLKSKLNPS